MTADVESQQAGRLTACVGRGCRPAVADVPDAALLVAGSRRAEVFETVATHPGQTKFWLASHIGVKSGAMERAIRQLLADGLIGRVPDRRGTARYVPLVRWVRGDIPPQDWEAS